VTIAQNATTGMMLGNYTYFITAKAQDGTQLPPIAMAVAVTDRAPSFLDTLGTY